ncbi:MAG: ABC transporter permease [Pseudomonadota bacterium]
MATQLRILFALMMREMSTRFGRSPGGFAWAFLEPVGYIALLSLVFVLLSRSPPLGQSFPLFFAGGFLPYYVFRTISGMTANAIRFNQALLTYPSVTPIDTALARFLLQFLTNAVITILILAVLVTWQERWPVIRPIFMIQAFLLAALLGLGIGLLNAVLFSVSPVWERIYTVLTQPLFIVSGIFYLADLLPPEIRDTLYWNPIVNLVAVMRKGIFAQYDAPHADSLYVFAIAAFCLLPGFFFLRAFRARLTEQ